MKRFGSLNSCASDVIGKVEVLEPNITLSPMTSCTFLIASAFTLRSSNTASMTRSQSFSARIVGGRRDARQQRVAVGGGGAAARDLIADHLVRMGLALVGARLVAVDQHDVDAGLRRDIADAGAHEAGADDADLLDLRRRHSRGPPRALVEFLHRDEQRADHRGGFRRAHDLGEVARLDAQREVHRQLQAFVDRLQDRARGRIVVVGLAAIDRVGGGPRHHAALGIDRPARQA